MADGSSCYGQLSANGRKCEPCDDKPRWNPDSSRTSTGGNGTIRVISATPQRRMRSRKVYTDIKHINRNIYNL